MSFIGLVDGSFYGARRNPDGKMFVVRNNENTKGASFYYSIDELGAGIKLEEEYPNFEPRTRSWYIVAEEAGRVAYSDVYMHFVFSEPTITVSRPVYDEANQMLGVFGVNYLLSWMDDVLEKLSIGDHGQIFIADSEGMLISTTLDMEKYIVVDDKLELINVSESNNEYIQETLTAFDGRKEEKPSKIYIEDEKYYAGTINMDIGNLLLD